MNQETMKTMVSIKSHIELERAEVERRKQFRALCEKEEAIPSDVVEQLDAITTVQEEHVTRCEGVLSELLKLKEDEEAEKKEDEPL